MFRFYRLPSLDSQSNEQKIVLRKIVCGLVSSSSLYNYSLKLFSISSSSWRKGDWCLWTRQSTLQISVLHFQEPPLFNVAPVETTGGLCGFCPDGEKWMKSLPSWNHEACFSSSFLHSRHLKDF